MGASLLVFANKSDVEGAMSVEDIQQVGLNFVPVTIQPAEVRRPCNST